MLPGLSNQNANSSLVGISGLVMGFESILSVDDL